MSAARVPWWLPLAAPLGAGLIRLLGATWRIDDAGTRAGDAEIAAGDASIFALWHSRLMPLAYTHRNRGVVVLVSRHHDGELIARVLARLGSATVRGSSTRGGSEALRDLLAVSTTRPCMAVTPDGPRGPRERVKSGIVYLASRTGFPIRPLALCADRMHRLASWDRFAIPLPFARVVVAYGDPIRVPPDLERDALEPWRVRTEASLIEVMRRTAALAGEPA